MEGASLDFKIHKAARVIEFSHCASAPPGGYIHVIIGAIFGWCARACGFISNDEHPLDWGWRNRPAFFWERPEFTPEKSDLDQARKALEVGASQLRGGWEATQKSAVAAVQRMSRRRDGVATRESVNYITKANMGICVEEMRRSSQEVRELKQQISELQQQVSALSGLILKSTPAAQKAKKTKKAR